MKYLIGPLLSGILLAASFPPSPLGLLSLIAYVPLIISIVRYGETWTRWKTIRTLYVTFFVYHVGANWWVSSFQEQTDPYLFASGFALDLFHPFFLMLPWIAITSVRKRLGVAWMSIVAPFAIAGFEWLHGQTDASYPWLTSGYALIYTPLSQVAEWIGVYGLSFLIGVVNVLVVFVVTLQRRQRIVAVTVSLVAIWTMLGVLLQSQASQSMKDVNAGKSQSLTIALVQPNENPWDKWEDPRAQLERHIQMVDTAQPARVFIWSETAIPFMILQPEYEPVRRQLTEWVDSLNIHVLTGFAEMHVYEPGTAPPSSRRLKYDSAVQYDVFNAAMILSPAQKQIPIHRKSMLTPFAERLPFADQLTFAMSWVQWGVGISSWGKGQTRFPLPVVENGDTLAKIGVIICIESIYPEVARDFVNNGADMLCVITNDAWYNATPGPRQHFDISRMRAIEQRRTLVRCANSGITGVIGPDGSSMSELPDLTKGICNQKVSTSSVRTVYSSIGDVIPPFGLFASIVLFIAARFSSFVRKMPLRFQS